MTLVVRAMRLGIIILIYDFQRQTLRLRHLVLNIELELNI